MCIVVSWHQHQRWPGPQGPHGGRLEVVFVRLPRRTAQRSGQKTLQSNHRGNVQVSTSGFYFLFFFYFFYIFLFIFKH